MSNSCSNLVDNLSDGRHNNKCINCKSFLDYMVFKDNQVIFRCFESRRNYMRDFNKVLIKRLRKGVYPYEDMDSWERFDETSLPNKGAFYSSLNMEDITDFDYRHAKRVVKYFNDKNLGDFVICMFKVIH